MATHGISMTCYANEEITKYSIVKIINEENPTNGLPSVENCDTGSDTIFGICMMNAEAGDLVTVRNPFSGILPAYVYPNARPGDGLTIGLGNPGSLSTNTGSAYARKVAYVMQIGGGTTEPTRSAVIFTRARFI